MTRRQVREDLRMYLSQVVITFFFGLCIDLCMYIIRDLNPIGYISQMGNLLIGCLILALGIALEVKADVAMMAGEYFVRVLSKRFRKDFGYMKLGFDWSLVALAVILSFCFMGGLYGVREGTVIAALLVGPIVHFVSPWYRFIDTWITDKTMQTVPTDAAAPPMPHTVITIAREFGSGGHLLGEMLAKRLGIRLYDKEFIHLAAQKSGIDEAYIRSNEQSIPSFWLKCILTDGNESSRQQACRRTTCYSWQRATSSASKQPRSLASSWDVVQTTSCKTLPASSRFSAIPTGRVLTNDAPRNTAYRQTRHVPRLPASTATASPTTNTIPARNGETRTAMT